MKKITFLFFLCSFWLVNSQNLVVNGDFELWTDASTPEGFTLIENITQEQVEVHGGQYAAKHEGGTKKIGQNIAVTGGKTYTISIWYKVDATGIEGTTGPDGDDARIWSYWRDSNGQSISTNTDEIQGPNGGYFDNNNNVWTEYTTTVTAPANAVSIDFEFRTYSKAIVYWDDFSMIEEAVASPSLGINSPDNGDPTPGPDVTIDFDVLNFTVANGTGDGHIHYTVDNGDPIMKYDTDPIDLTGLSYGEHTVTLELVDNSHASLDPAVTATTTFTTFALKTLPLTESFDYTAGETLGAQTDWLNQNSGDEVMIKEGSLSYTTFAGTGNSIEFDGSGMDPAVVFEPVSTGSLFSSFLFSVTNFSETATNGYVAALRTDAGFYNSKLWVSPTSASTYKLGVSAGSSLTEMTTAEFNINDVVFIILGYDVTNDVAQLWVNPTTGGAEVAADLTETNQYPGNTFNQFVVRQDSGNETPNIVMDELRLGLTWGDVNPASLNIAKNGSTAFKIYPNPVSNGTVTITSQFTEAITATIFDVLGKVVINERVDNNTLDVSQLNKGIYLMKLTQNGASETQKLVIK